MDNCIQKWLLRFLKSILGVRSSTPSWRVLRNCVTEPIQFNWLRATVFHADTALSSRNLSCCPSHLSFTTDGLHHADAFQLKIRSANPLDLSQIVVDYRSGHLAYWRQISALHP
eukprot:1148500-Pelagomonas_calceolata.AAC.2